MRRLSWVETSFQIYFPLINVFDTRSLVEEREESLSELKGKFIRNQQILNSNWQQAEEEVS